MENFENESIELSQYEKDLQDEEFQRIVERQQQPFVIEPDDTVFYTSPEIEEQEHKYTLTISSINNNFVVDNLSMNGNNYVSETEIDTSNWPDIFELTVKNDKGNIVEHYEHARLIQQVQYDWDSNKYYLAFSQISAQEIQNETMTANIEYIAMMSDIEL